MRVDRLDETETFVYDAVGNLLARVDAKLNVTEYAYDRQNRRSLETLPDPDGDGPLTEP